MLPLPISKKIPGAAVRSQNTLMDSTRVAILRELRAAGWVVGGSGGAAARLGLKRTTLLAKMKKLGITRPVPQNDMQLSDSEQCCNRQLSERTPTDHSLSPDIDLSDCSFEQS